MDALITRGDEVLLIRRGQYPGKGLLALPGGFLDPGERIAAAARRELAEETGLALADAVEPVSVFVADHPDRSDRGRFITHVYHFELDPAAPRPAVQGGDDAASAAWYPLADLPSAELFEDHRQILEHVLGVGRLAGARRKT